MTEKEKFKEAKRLYQTANADQRYVLETLFPELHESEDERIRKELIEYIKDQQSSFISAPDCRDKYEEEENNKYNSWIAWLEKQWYEPNWCHHKVDLSNCTEEYRKAYYDGWNNCNQQHSQCKSESNDVVKCLINGMKFYYEGNEEATWGAEKFSMKIKDILSWLEKQEGKHKTEPQSRWWPSEEQMEALAWALSLAKSCGEERAFDLRTLYEQLKKLTE